MRKKEMEHTHIKRKRRQKGFEREGEGMKITVKETETLHRMIGTIEGAVFGMGKRETIICDALEVISSILDESEVVTERGEPE